MRSSFVAGSKPNSILPSLREGIFYLEHCRVLVRGERVEYAIDREDAGTYFWNIPTGNTTVILLGSGTSLTQAAARRLSEDGVVVGFVGGGGSPLFLASQSEYRQTEFCQGWYRQWVDPVQRIELARYFQMRRIAFVEKAWSRLEEIKAKELSPSVALAAYKLDCQSANTSAAMMESEARCAKRLYALLANAFGAQSFVREHGKRDNADLANSFLDHGNYLAYGLAAVVLWVYGIPHSLPVSHGMTRRGALVFDVADLVKDGIVMPLAFACAEKGMTDQAFRGRCIQELQRLRALEWMFEVVKAAALGTFEQQQAG